MFSVFTTEGGLKVQNRVAPVAKVFFNADDSKYYRIRLSSVGGVVVPSFEEVTDNIPESFLNPDDGKYYELAVQTVDGVPVGYYKETGSYGRYYNPDDGLYYSLVPQLIGGSMVPTWTPVS